MKLFKPWKSCFYVLLLHPTEAKVLIRSSNDNYCLPYAEINKEIWFDDFQAIKNTIEQELSITVNVLHYATYQVDKGKHEIRGIYVVEQHNSTEEIQVGTWCDHAVPALWADLQTLESLSFTYPKQKSTIEAYLIELESGNNPKLRPPWAQPGWFSQVSTWIREELEKLGYKQIAPIEYVRNWSISCVLKIQTTAGNIYFKQASTFLPLFCDEPIVTRELASLFPQHIPTVISIDRQRHWMLLDDFGKPIGDNVSLKVQQDIYRLFAQIQIQSVEHRAHLLAVGCLNRGLDILHSQIDPLINDENSRSELSTAEIDRLYTLAPDLKNLCSQLASYKIPETLVHGDLHLNNIASYKNSYLFFDWTDSCISHPFFDLFELFLEGNQKSFLGRLQGLWKQKSRQRLRDHYLSQWTQYEPRERLLDAWKIAKPLCFLHHAVTYQNMISNLEARTKQEVNALPYFLRQIIRYYSLVNN
ncbi:MAG: phosphotransferase family protein [Xenococcaceae cyanobacterium]